MRPHIIIYMKGDGVPGTKRQKYSIWLFEYVDAFHVVVVEYGGKFCPTTEIIE